MSIKRRDFLKLSAGTAIAGTGIITSACSSQSNQSDNPFKNLKPMIDGIKPITVEERLARIEKAKELMRKNKIDAIYLEAGTGLFYFTGISWWQSERMLAAIIPVKGDIAYVCPKFEEDRVRELMIIGDDVRTWEEDESPYKHVAKIFIDRGIKTGCIGIEERVRFFLYDGIRKETPHLEYISADPITIECRVIKSPNEIAMMQRASDITIAAYKAAIPLLKKGMTSGEFRELSRKAHSALGVSGGIGAQFGESSSFPHGSSKPRNLREGDIVLMDGGCRVDGYKSDISRTIVFGKLPTQKQKDIWHLASRAKEAAFRKAGVGVPCEDVDAAARKVHVDYGFGPNYKIPGCPHRTGHGIGLDGHEWINLVRGNKRPMEAGMCFSNEPMVVVPGEFGVRLEDCMYITEDGPVYFSGPSPSIDQPFI